MREEKGGGEDMREEKGGGRGYEGGEGRRERI